MTAGTKNILKNNLKSGKWLQDILLISFIYILIHGFMLILTGTFHDDWLSFFHDVQTKHMEGMESGRPYYSLVIMMVWNLPRYGFRILAFFTYWAAYLFTYGTFYSVKGLSHRDAAMITILVIASPVNDARVLLANYPYALGMLLFFAASFLLARNIGRVNKAGVRIAVLILFFLSFTTNSNLVLYGVVLLYLLMSNNNDTASVENHDFSPPEHRPSEQCLPERRLPERRLPERRLSEHRPSEQCLPEHRLPERSLRQLAARLLSSAADMIRNLFLFPDFVLLPVLFYVLNKSFFPVYGAYSDYNTVTRQGLKRAFLSIPKMVTDTLLSILTRLFVGHTWWRTALFFAVLALIIEYFVKKKYAKKEYSKKESPAAHAVLFTFGLIAFAAGLFPYAVVRQTTDLYHVGIESRDLILTGLGIALMLYGCAGRRIRTAVIVFWCITGFFHFNDMYLNYQKEWYRQLSFQRQIADLDLVPNGNYIVICDQESEIKDRRYYTWSGNASAATGRRDLFLMSGKKDTDRLGDREKMQSILTHFPMFRDYQYDHDSIDGRLLFSADLTCHDTIRLKIDEMFDRRAFENRIDALGDLTLVTDQDHDT